MKLITHSVNYYGQRFRLYQIYAEWSKWKDLSVATQIIDDGHPNFATIDFEVPHQLARITTDIPYNCAGTINLAVSLCSTPYLLHSDMDINVSYGDMLNIIRRVEGWEEEGITDHVLFFDLIHSTGMHKSTGAWLCPTPLFWKLGGFNEDFCGHYGWEDAHFYEKVCKHAKPELAAFPLTFLPEYSVDMERDHSYNRKLLDQLISEGLPTKSNNPLRFQFEVIR